MFVMRFTERAYFNYTEDDVKSSPGGAHRVTFSNSHFDPAVAADQYNYYLDEWQYCEEIGFDGMMLNEHHSTPTSLGAAMNLEAAILARITKKPKIVLMGNPLPIHDNPCGWPKNWRRSTAYPEDGWYPDLFGAAAPRAGLPTPTPFITGNVSRRPTTWWSRPGQRLVPSAGRASTTTSGT